MNEVRARVILQEREIYRIESEYGEKYAEVAGRFQYGAKTVSDYPAVGDYVTANWPDDESAAIITGLFPRKSCLIRKAAGKGYHEQVVAANVDTVFICMSLNHDFNLRRIERYVSIAWDSGAAPVIILTKADLCTDVEEKVLAVRRLAVGVDIAVVSSLWGDTDGIMNYLSPGKTVAFLGSSGVGKSTLINGLLGKAVIETQSIGWKDKGRHTTTHREVIRLRNGAYVIDTPGMRELGMWDSGQGIETAFADVEDLIGACRFGDCSHTGEPGCAVQAALANGELDSQRWDSYLKLKKENAYASSGGVLAEKEKKFREISKINKHNRRNSGR